MLSARNPLPSARALAEGGPAPSARGVPATPKGSRAGAAARTPRSADSVAKPHPKGASVVVGKAAHFADDSKEQHGVMLGVDQPSAEAEGGAKEGGGAGRRSVAKASGANRRSMRMSMRKSTREPGRARMSMKGGGAQGSSGGGVRASMRKPPPAEVSEPLALKPPPVSVVQVGERGYIVAPDYADEEGFLGGVVAEALGGGQFAFRPDGKQVGASA